jgi:hypothetical protein
MSSNNLSVVPASAVLSPNDSVNNLNLVDFSNIGRNISADSTAFKKIQNFSKLNPQFIYTQPASYYTRFHKVNNLYVNELSLDNINPSVSLYRQHNYTSLKTSLNMFTTLVDTSSFKKFFAYTADTADVASPRLLPRLSNDYHTPNLFSNKNQHLNSFFNAYTSKLTNSLNLSYTNKINGQISITDHLVSPSRSTSMVLPSSKATASIVNNQEALPKMYDFTPNLKLSSQEDINGTSDSSSTFKTLNLKSGGQSITTQEKSLREITKSNPLSSFQNNFFALQTTFLPKGNLPFNNSTIFNSTALG